MRFGEPETTSLKEENGKRPNFFSFWPNEVPKKLELGVFGCSESIGTIFIAI